MQFAIVRDFKAHLARYLRLVESGESVAVTRHGKPVALVTRPRPRARDAARATAEERLEEALRDGTILPASGPHRLPRLTARVRREGRRALARLLKDRRS